MKMKAVFVFVVLFLNIQIANGAENDYGTVKAWFNGQNATVEGIQLKIGEPSEVKVEITSKIDGTIYVKLKEPGTTEAFEILSGPSRQNEWIDIQKVNSGWSDTFTWMVTPNGAWKNGNAPINIRVSFSKKGDQKPIEFTIANPYILDEQYPGSSSTPAQTSGITHGVTAPKEAPFVPAIAALAVMLAVWWWRRG